MNFSEIIKNAADKVGSLEKNLLEIENQYSAMLICDPSEIEEINENIASCREKADVCLSEIKQICSEDETGLIKKAVNPGAKHFDIDVRTEEIFQKRQAVNAVIVRIQNLMPAVSERLELKKEETLALIKENNQSQSANAAKYFSKEDRDPVYLTRKGKTI